MCTLCGWARAFSITDAPQLTRGEFLAASAAAGAVATLPDGKADVVFTNGAVYTVNPRQPWAKVVGVRGNRIAYVGDDAGAAGKIGPRTQVVDLRGRMLLPGFVEGHIHPFVGAGLTQGVDLQYDTREETLQVLSAYARQNHDGLVRGFGWRYNAFPPTGPRKEDLDAIWPDRPVFLAAIDGHAGWANSRALEIAGVTKDTPDPVPGFSFFERDPQTGVPTGYLVEVPCMVHVMNASEPFTFASIAASLARWLPRAAAAGITAIFDAGAIIVPEDAAFAHYVDLENQGKLPFRVVGCHYYNDPKTDPLPIVEALRRKYHSELVRAAVLKLNVDGGDAQYTAAMLAPYHDKPDTSGQLLLPEAVLNRVVREADLAGIDLHCHSFGDRATHLTLDAIEAAIAANPPRDRRHALAHLPYVSPGDVARFGEMGVIAQFSSQWAVPDANWSGVTKSRWGARADDMYPIGSILRRSGRIALGTDWPAAAYYSTFKPLEGIQVAITRRQLGDPDGATLSPQDERIDLAQALHANTFGAAYQLRLDAITGSIEAGKRADLVVLEKNLFEIPPYDIHTTKVSMTMMNGRFTHGG